MDAIKKIKNSDFLIIRTKEILKSQNTVDKLF